MRLKVFVQPEAEGGFSVSVPGLPGCFSEGETLPEALANVREAAELWLEVQSERSARLVPAYAAFSPQWAEIEL